MGIDSEFCAVSIWRDGTRLLLCQTAVESSGFLFCSASDNPRSGEGVGSDEHFVVWLLVVPDGDTEVRLCLASGASALLRRDVTSMIIGRWRIDGHNMFLKGFFFVQITNSDAMPFVDDTNSR